VVGYTVQCVYDLESLNGHLMITSYLHKYEYINLLTALQKKIGS